MIQIYSRPTVIQNKSPCNQPLCNIIINCVTTPSIFREIMDIWDNIQFNKLYGL